VLVALVVHTVVEAEVAQVLLEPRVTVAVLAVTVFLLL
jgi:hypothetical protein